jgi:hypothetical protein
MSNSNTPLDLVTLGHKVGVSRNTLLRLCKSNQLAYTNDDGVVKATVAAFHRRPAGRNHP